MKRAALFLLALLLFMNTTSAGHCQDAFRKLGRGVVNIVASPLEFTKAVGDSYQNGGVFEVITYGIFKGGIMMVVRAGLSCYEAVTFPIPLPENYKPILQPEFAWQKE